MGTNNELSSPGDGGMCNGGDLIAGRLQEEAREGQQTAFGPGEGKAEKMSSWVNVGEKLEEIEAFSKKLAGMSTEEIMDRLERNNNQIASIKAIMSRIETQIAAVQTAQGAQDFMQPQFMIG